MAALCNRAGRYIFALWFLSFFFFSSPNLSGRSLPYFHTWCGLSENLGCRSETWCTRLAGNAGPNKSPKSRHLGTIPQLCRAISSQLRQCIDNRKKHVKQQYLLHMSPQYGELRSTTGWDRLASLGHPRKFQRGSHLGSVTARYSSSGRQPNFAALDRRHHLFGRTAITLGIGPHSSLMFFFVTNNALANCKCNNCSSKQRCNMPISEVSTIARVHYLFMYTTWYIWRHCWRRSHWNFIENWSSSAIIALNDWRSFRFRFRFNRLRFY